MRTARDLTAEDLASYRAAAREREKGELENLRLRESLAWELAHQAAALLRRDFGVTRVVVYGSLVHPGAFSPWSDVDIAAWGLQPRDTWRALGALMDLSSEIELNLIDVSMCRPAILDAIEREGVTL